MGNVVELEVIREAIEILNRQGYYIMWTGGDTVKWLVLRGDKRMISLKLLNEMDTWFRQRGCYIDCVQSGFDYEHSENQSHVSIVVLGLNE